MNLSPRTAALKALLAAGSVDRIEDHQPRIVGHAIGIFERGAEWPLQRIADRVVGDIDRR